MFETGTANNHNDLLDKLVTFLTGQCGWTELDYVPQTGAEAIATTILRAPGISAGNEFFLYIDTQFNIGSGFYSWRMRASVDYDPDIAISAQLGLSPSTFFNLWQNTTDYWFFGNGRRFIAVAKCNTSYMSAYAGCMLPFALPSEYPKPFYIGASYTSMTSYDQTNAASRMIADPGTGSAYFLNQDVTTWRSVYNHSSQSGNFAIGETPAFIWPARSVVVPSSNGSGWAGSNEGLTRLRPNLNGEAPQFLCHIIDVTESRAIGVLEGVYSIPGFNRTSEQVIGVDDKSFIVFQNTYRTTTRDYMAIERIDS